MPKFVTEMPRFVESRTAEVFCNPETPRLDEGSVCHNVNISQESPAVILSVPISEKTTNGISQESPAVIGSVPISEKTTNAADVDIMKALEAISFELQTNLKFTKAIYRRTKKSLTGAGNEMPLLHSFSDNGMPSYRSRNSDRFSWRDVERSMDRQRGSTRFSDKSIAIPSPMSGKGEQPSSSLSVSGLQLPTEAGGLRTTIGSTSIVSLSNDDQATPRTPGIAETHETPRVKMASTIDSSHTTTIETIVTQHQELQNRRSVKIWRFMEDPSSSRSARVYFHVRMLFLAFSVITACIQFFVESLVSDAAWTWMQLAIEVCFCAELVARFCVCGDRFAFVFAGFNVIDLVSACLGGLRMYVLVSSENLLAIHAILGIVPVVRLLRLLRHFDTFQLLWSAFHSAAEAMPMLIFTLFTITCTFAAVIYFCEPRSSIPSMPVALYFSIVSVTTLGFGDISPVSGSGRIWTCLLAIIGPMYMAIPFGIIGTAFSQVWEDRHRLLMLHLVRKCVKNNGYSVKELGSLFELIDRNGDGTVDLDEFISWLHVLEIRMPDHIVTQVFESFDADDEGTIDFQELLRGLFPRSKTEKGFHRIRDSLRLMHSSFSETFSFNFSTH